MNPTSYLANMDKLRSVNGQISQFFESIKIDDGERIS